jgi:hypothetical protein
MTDRKALNQAHTIRHECPSTAVSAHTHTHTHTRTHTHAHAHTNTHTHTCTHSHTHAHSHAPPSLSTMSSSQQAMRAAAVPVAAPRMEVAAAAARPCPDADAAAADAHAAVAAARLWAASVRHALAACTPPPSHELGAERQQRDSTSWDQPHGAECRPTPRPPASTPLEPEAAPIRQCRAFRKTCLCVCACVCVCVCVCVSMRVFGQQSRRCAATMCTIATISAMRAHACAWLQHDVMPPTHLCSVEHPAAAFSAVCNRWQAVLGDAAVCRVQAWADRGPDRPTRLVRHTSFGEMQGTSRGRWHEE